MHEQRISRIREMEEIYDRVRKDIATLREYEESGLWLQDYEADERGELPRDFKRGVLSQDGLDEVFEEAKALVYFEKPLHMEFNDVLQRRYSCRAFASTPVEQDKVGRILEAGRIAPTAVNKQPVHIWAVSDPDKLEAIKGVTRSNYGAPLILVVGCRPSEAWVRRYDGKNGAEVDAAINATYLMLAAENEGLATLWVGSFDPALLAGILPGTEGYDLIAMINVGYPAAESTPSQMHNVRKSLAEFVTEV